MDRRIAFPTTKPLGTMKKYREKGKRKEGKREQEGKGYIVVKQNVVFARIILPEK